MEITRQDREALDEILEFFDDCKDLTEEHVNAMLVILAEHRERAVSAANEKLRAVEGERDGLRELLQNVREAFADGTLTSGLGNGKGKNYAIQIAASVELALNTLSQPGKGGE